MATEGVEPDYIRVEILAPFFANFWVRRMALDRRNYRALVETTVEIANKVHWTHPSPGNKQAEHDSIVTSLAAVCGVYCGVCLYSVVDCNLTIAIC